MPKKGRQGRPLKLMIVGIPNVGKSTFINQIAGRKGARAENRPRRHPREAVGHSGSGAVAFGHAGDPLAQVRGSGGGRQARLYRSGQGRYPGRGSPGLPSDAAALRTLPGRGQRPATALGDQVDDTTGYALLEAAGRKRGFLLRGGEIDTERMARVLLEEYRSGKLGRITFERPDEEGQAHDGSLGN